MTAPAEKCLNASTPIVIGPHIFSVFCKRETGHSGSHRGMIELISTLSGEWGMTIKAVWK